ncbi:MAG TPA: hypothetical protein VI076_03385, partial [Actinopolymorphaceae bacterium]
MIPPEPSRPGHHRARRRRRFRPVLSTLVGFGLAGVVGILAAVGLILGGPPSAGTTRSVLAQEAADTQKALVSARPTTRAGHLRATRLDEVKLLLDKQAEAILASDKRTYLSTIDPAESNRAFAAAAERTFDNLVRMRVVSFGFDRIAEDPGGLTPQRQRALGAAALVVEATMRFRVPGVDYRNVWTTPLRMVFVE